MKSPDATGRPCVVFPEKGVITDCGVFGKITEHGCASLGMEPLSKEEERKAKEKRFDGWPRMRVERWLCTERLMKEST